MENATLPTGSNRRFELRSSPSISSPEDPSKARRFAMAQACQLGERRSAVLQPFSLFPIARSIRPRRWVSMPSSRAFCEFRAPAPGRRRRDWSSMKRSRRPWHAERGHRWPWPRPRVIFSKEPVKGDGLAGKRMAGGDRLHPARPSPRRRKRASRRRLVARGSAKKSAIAWRQPDRPPPMADSSSLHRRLARARRRVKPLSPFPEMAREAPRVGSRRRGECRAHRGSG